MTLTLAVEQAHSIVFSLTISIQQIAHDLMWETLTAEERAVALAHLGHATGLRDDIIKRLTEEEQ